MSDEFEKEYSEEKLWDKIKNNIKKAGKEVVYKALLLFYVLSKKDLPHSSRAIIIGALGYFISPIDAITDIAPGGFFDDLGVIAMALAHVKEHIDDNVREKASGMFTKLFKEEYIENKN